MPRKIKVRITNKNLTSSATRAGKSFVSAMVTGLVAAGLFSFILYAFATYTPGETLNPTCSPGASGCTVTAPALYSFGSNNFSGTGTFTTTGALGAGAITGTSFIIGANTLTTSEWAYLDGINQTVATTSGPTFANITDSGLTITRVPYASTAGLLVDSANLTFDGTTLTAGGFTTTGALGAGAITGTSLNINSTAVANATLLTLESDINEVSEYNEILFNVVGGLNYGAIRNYISAGGEGSLAFFGATGNALSSEIMRIKGDGNVGIGTTGPDAKLDVLSATEQLRLTYTDGTVYSSFTTGSGGDLTITASGGDISFDNENLTTTGTGSFGALTATGTATLGDATIDIHGINTAAVTNQMLTASYVNSTDDTTPYFLKGTQTISGNTNSERKIYGYSLTQTLSGTDTYAAGGWPINYGFHLAQTDSTVLNTTKSYEDYGIYSTTTFSGTVTAVSNLINYAGYFSAGGNMGTAVGATEHFGLYSTASGTADTNYGLYVSASGATTNYGIWVDAGDVVLDNDSQLLYFGEEQDASITYTGTYWDFDIAQATTAIRFNQANIDTDFSIGGDTNDNAFYVDAGNERVGILTSTPSYRLDIDTTDVTVAKFGASLAVYLIANAPNVGFNAYYDATDLRWEFGAGSSTNYAGTLTLDAAGGTGLFMRVSNAAGNANGAITWLTPLTLQHTGNIKIGSGVAGYDQVLTFDGETNDGVLTWMEDEDYFLFSDAIALGAATGVKQSAAAGVLTLAGIGNTNNENLTLDFEATANTVKIGTGTGVTTLDLNAIALTTTGTGTLGKLVVDTTTLVVNATGYEDRVGIGTATPGFPVSIASTLTETAATASIGVSILNTLSPASTSGANFRVLSMSNTFAAPSVNFTGTSTNAASPGWFENRINNAGTIAEMHGMSSFGLFAAGAAATLGTVTEVDAGWFQPLNSFSNSLTTTIAKSVGVRIIDSTKGSFVMTGQAGILIEALAAGTNNTSILIGTTTIPTGAFGIYNASTNDNYFAGDIGIGTTAPDRVLEINSATGINLRLTYNDSNGSAANYTDFLTGSNGALTMTSTANSFTFGNGVADTDTAVNFTGSTNSGLLTWMEDEDYFLFSDNFALGTAADANTFSTATHGASSTVMYIGNSTINVTAPSDIRTKENIESTTRGINDLMNFSVKDFTYRKEYVDEGTDQEEHIGLIAQEVESVFPEAIIYRSDNFRAIDYNKLIPLIIKSVQDLKNQIGGSSVTLSQSGAVGSGSISGVSGSSFSAALLNVGMNIIDGVATLKQVIVENLTAKTARIEKIEMVDSATGDVWCTWIANGEWQKTKGECASATVANAVEQSPALAPVQIETPALVEQTPQASSTEEIVQQVTEQVTQQTQEVTQQAAQEAVQQATQEVVQQVAEQATQQAVEQVTQQQEQTAKQAAKEAAKEIKEEIKQEVKEELQQEEAQSAEVPAEEAPVEEAPVEEQTPVEPAPAEEVPSIGDVIQDAAAGLLQSIWEFVKWGTGSLIQGGAKIMPKVKDFGETLKVGLEVKTPEIMEKSTAGTIAPLQDLWEFLKLKFK